MRLLRALLVRAFLQVRKCLLNREPNGFPFFFFVFVTNRNAHPLFVQHFCHSMAEKAFAFLLLSLSLSLPLTPLSPTQHNSYHVLHDAALVRVVATARLSISSPRP
jgi:hypothetical protein